MEAVGRWLQTARRRRRRRRHAGFFVRFPRTFPFKQKASAAPLVGVAEKSPWRAEDASFLISQMKSLQLLCRPPVTQQRVLKTVGDNRERNSSRTVSLCQTGVLFWVAVKGLFMRLWRQYNSIHSFIGRRIWQVWFGIKLIQTLNLNLNLTSTQSLTKQSYGHTYWVQSNEAMNESQRKKAKLSLQNSPCCQNLTYHLLCGWFDTAEYWKYPTQGHVSELNIITTTVTQPATANIYSIPPQKDEENPKKSCCPIIHLGSFTYFFR